MPIEEKKNPLRGQEREFLEVVTDTDTESQKNSDQLLQNKPCLGSECRNDDSEVLPESQSLIGQVYDQNTFDVSKVKQKQH